MMTFFIRKKKGQEKTNNGGKKRINQEKDQHLSHPPKGPKPCFLTKDNAPKEKSPKAIFSFFHVFFAFFPFKNTN